MHYSMDIVESMDVEPEEKAELRTLVNTLNMYIDKCERLTEENESLRSRIGWIMNPESMGH
jgi:uncharacterized protein (UPF0335 family)